MKGILTGFSKVDQELGDIKPGQFAVLAGAAGSGKSIMAVNIAVNAAVRHGKNVVVVLPEMTLQHYLYMLYACHSNNPKFGEPVILSELKAEMASNGKSDRLNLVVEDFKSGDYGKIIPVSCLPDKSFFTDNSHLESINKETPIDLIIIDSFDLFCMDDSKSESFVNTIKNFARSFDGRGVPVIACTQISERARASVSFEPGKFYTRSSNNICPYADVIMFVLRTDEMCESHELGIGIIKSESSESSPILFKLKENFASVYVGDLK